MAKSIGTAAHLADGRVELGVGVGWCAEEFELMGQRFDRRGKRTEEMLDLDAGALAAVLDRVRRRVLCDAAAGDDADTAADTILIGGLSDIAMRRAARYDGWVGDLITTERAIAAAQRLRELSGRKWLDDGRFHHLDPADGCLHDPRLRACRSRWHHPRPDHAVDVLLGAGGRWPRRSTACRSSAGIWRWTAKHLRGARLGDVDHAAGLGWVEVRVTRLGGVVDDELPAESRDEVIADLVAGVDGVGGTLDVCRRWP